MFNFFVKITAFTTTKQQTGSTSPGEKFLQRKKFLPLSPRSSPISQQQQQLQQQQQQIASFGAKCCKYVSNSRLLFVCFKSVLSRTLDLQQEVLTFFSVRLVNLTGFFLYYGSIRNEKGNFFLIVIDRSSVVVRFLLQDISSKFIVFLCLFSFYI